MADTFKDKPVKVQVATLVIATVTVFGFGISFQRSFSNIEQNIALLTHTIDYSSRQNTVEHAQIDERLDKHDDRILLLESTSVENSTLLITINDTLNSWKLR